MDEMERLTQRALEFLEREAAARGTPGVEGVVVQLDPAAGDIASLMGMSRAEATRALNALKLRGVIRMEGSTVILRRS